MLISDTEFARLGDLVMAMLASDETPVEFWLISDKIIDAHLNAKRMCRVPEEVKEGAKFFARVKLHANIRKFSPAKWHSARESKGHKPLPDNNKGIYEFVCLIVRNNIIKTITDTTKRSSIGYNVPIFDLASTSDIMDIAMIDFSITKHWLDTKLKSQGVRDGIGD